MTAIGGVTLSRPPTAASSAGEQVLQVLSAFACGICADVRMKGNGESAIKHNIRGTI